VSPLTRNRVAAGLGEAGVADRNRLR